MLSRLRSYFRASTRSLKTTLAVYFIPIMVVPAIFISFYAIRLFQDSNDQNLVRRSESEKEAIVAELESTDADLMLTARAHAKMPALLAGMSSRNRQAIQNALSGLRPGVEIRIFSPEGNLLGERKGNSQPKQIPYISAEGLRRVKTRGETQDRYFLDGELGFVTVTRVLARDDRRLYGVIEEEFRFGDHQLSDLKNRRQLDIAFFSRDLSKVAGSFAIDPTEIKKFANDSIPQTASNVRKPIYLQLGEARYAGFLYDLPLNSQKNRQWGYIGVFLSMSSVDVTVGKLKLALAYLTLFLVLIAALLIFILSNRLVKPIEILVSAMRRLKTGRVEQIPPIDSTYEIEYLVHSFNEMARNVSAAKRALELKLDELRSANEEIKDAQSHLVQSAKMASLGQIVAGVAHELNNPIGFIYSNMHHLQQYVARFNQLVAAYRDLYEKLPADAREKIQRLEKELEVDFVLKDMDDLTRSCLEGANRTKEIVLGLRTFSRMDESTFRPADIHEGIRSTLKLLNSEFKDRVTVHESYGNIPQVECNISQLNQVFMNLLANAAHAIEGKGEIWIRTRVENEDALIEIEDSGVGIPPDQLEKIFDPFFTTKRIGQGTGLGLSIAYGLVQKHNGEIYVTSQVGRGTRFIVRVPLKQPALSQSA